MKDMMNTAVLLKTLMFFFMRRMIVSLEKMSLVTHAFAFFPLGEQQSVFVSTVVVYPLTLFFADANPPFGTLWVTDVGILVTCFLRCFRSDALFLCDGER